MRSARRLPRAQALLASLLLVLACTGAAQGAQAVQPFLSISAEPSRVPVGGEFRLTLRYALPPGAQIVKPPEIKGIEGLTTTGMVSSDGRITLTVIADSLDPVAIGPVELACADKAGRKSFLRSGSLKVEVVSNLKEGADARNPKPILGIVPTRSFWSRWALPAGAALLALALAALAYLAWKRWKNGWSSPLPVDPPHVRAEKEIEALLGEGLFEQGLQKAFYFRFTEIVKRYLEDLRGFPAAECTTEEIAQRVIELDRPVLAILRYADLVKFADEQATPDRKEADVSAFLAYLDVTAPKPAEEPGQALEGNA